MNEGLITNEVQMSDKMRTNDLCSPIISLLKIFVFIDQVYFRIKIKLRSAIFFSQVGTLIINEAHTYVTQI